MTADNYERVAVLVVSVLLILGDVALHAVGRHDGFTDQLALIAVGALYMGVVPARRPPSGPVA